MSLDPKFESLPDSLIENVGERCAASGSHAAACLCEGIRVGSRKQQAAVFFVNLWGNKLILFVLQPIVVLQRRARQVVQRVLEQLLQLEATVDLLTFPSSNRGFAEGVVLFMAEGVGVQLAMLFTLGDGWQFTKIFIVSLLQSKQQPEDGRAAVAVGHLLE
ncbi:hypothetical protein EYF80_042991 [Liparis tanakae]|uniref:Uncharacterized protein n=1 Tax=Liparis tanakae TaxID=230148 RepID=A0A4Z2G0Q6_9TELE|nr:hypothetical protein EYF80_042991 [Liparis tanakae]